MNRNQNSRRGEILPPKDSFKWCGVAGLLFGGPLAIWLALHHGLSPWIELTLVAVAVGALLATPLAVKVLTGRDGFVFYRDVICIFAAVILTLRWLHQPVLPYLDVTMAGAGMFHACGRIGCLLSGCCYGRPYRLGVRYRHEHADMGFPAQLVGVRLFPIQAVESTWILCLAAGATLMILRPLPSGSAFALYATGYALGRFIFEFARGDADRPYWRGFSQAQWISLMLAGSVSAGTFAGVLPRSNWLGGALVLLMLAMLLIAIARRCEKTKRFELLHPRHIHEIAKALGQMAEPLNGQVSVSGNAWPRPEIKISPTSLGILLSSGQVARGGRRVRHYCVSRRGAPLSPGCVRLLARQISRLQHDSAAFEVSQGSHGVVHILFPR